MIRVAILDDQHIVLSGIQHMLQNNDDGIALIAAYQNYTAFASGLKESAPDVLLLDINMPDTTGDTVASFLFKNYPAIRIIALTNFDTTHHIKKMLYAGVKGYLLKNIDKATLIDAVKTVFDGGQYLEVSIKKQLLNEFTSQKNNGSSVPSLTKREKEVLHLIVKQQSSQEIADQLFLSLRTVENHRYNLFQKLDVKNVVGLITKSYELGLIKS